MNASLPPALAPYIHQCIEQRSLTLLTSVLDTPANWLVARLVVAALGGHDSRDTAASHLVGSKTAVVGHKIVLVSIWRSLDLCTELLRKSGLNLSDAINSGRVCYIDGLSTPRPPAISNTQNIIGLESLSLKSLTAALNRSVQTLASQETIGNVTVVIDGLDFLLASEPSITSTDIQQLILDLQSRVHNIIVPFSADNALLHNTEASATPLELEHSIAARSLAHGSRWVFQLRPLETGQSKEVSGSVRVSCGGAWDSSESGQDLEEGEWLYHVKADGSVRVWGRGEA